MSSISLVPEPCQGHLEWALDIGRFSNPTDPNYANFETITGVSLAEATFEDFQRLFVCEDIQSPSCNDQGLTFPSTCSVPPCGTCEASDVEQPPTESLPESPAEQPATEGPATEPTPEELVQTFVPSACQVDIEWALSTGRNSNPNDVNYANIEAITGVSLVDATFEDFQRLFKCNEIQRANCNDQGLTFPSTCSNPPCDNCGESVIAPEIPSDSVTYSPSTVTVSGYNIYVDGELFHINGVCWSPVPIGAGFGGELFAEWSTPDSQKMAEAGINALRTYRPILDEEVLNNLFANGIRVMVPILPIVNGRIATEDDVKYVVDIVKDHPSTLMYSLGNEWNLNFFYWDGLTIDDCVNWINMATRVIKENDDRHPVSTVYGDVPPALGEIVPRLPDVDIWALNTYRFDTFDGLFQSWQASGFNKPIILGEFGADAWDSRGAVYDPETITYAAGGQLNEASQADTTRKLLQEIYDYSTKAGIEGNQINSGGFIFEWSDEYWKRGSANAQDTEGIAPCPTGCGPAPDRAWNEDYWGLSRISRDYSSCSDQYNSQSTCPLRPAYYAYKEAPKP